MKLPKEYSCFRCKNQGVKLWAEKDKNLRVACIDCLGKINSHFGAWIPCIIPDEGLDINVWIELPSRILPSSKGEI